MQKVIVFISVIAGLVAAVAPVSRAGYSEGGAFKSPGYGARAWGMGGAAIATVSDESAVFWNPAMLGLLQSNTVGASYIDIVPGASARQSQLAYVHVIRRSGQSVEGLSVARHAAGVLFTNLRLGIRGADDYDENTIRLTYTYTPDYFISFAVALDLFASGGGVEGFDARGTSVDGALRMFMTENFSLGIVARNAFSRISYDDGTDFRKEREYAVGLSSRSIAHVTVEGDLVLAHSKASRWIFGVESDYLFDVLALRAGYALIRTGESRGVPYFGFGARYGRISVHYNANLDEEHAFSDTHRFTLSVSL
jgi:hypothetical protein